MPAYVDVLKLDGELNELGLRLLRSGATVEETATELLPLTEQFYEALSELSWCGYLIERTDDIIA